MPYIKQEDRDTKSPNPNENWEIAATAGDLNYQFTCMINHYLSDKVVNYAAYNAVIGALECCKLELYRRMVAPYEDTKIKENGDVYEIR